MKKKFFKDIKKKAEDFLLEEEGKISKAEIVKASTILMAASTLLISSEAYAYHANTIDRVGNGITHTSHSSHGSHGSHGSHCNSKVCM